MVQLIYRKKNSQSFSIEKVFQVIRPLLENKIKVTEHYALTRSAGLMAILKNLVHLRKIKGDLFHVTGDIHYSVFVFPRARTILTIHDCVFLNANSGIKRWIFKKLWLQWPVKYAKVITTISKKTKEEIIAHTNCKPDKIVIIDNPVSPAIYFEEKPFNRECPVILFIGTKSNKNIFRAIEALKGIPCKMEIIGELSSEQRQALTQAEISYTKYINLSEQELANRYAASDMVLFPSTYEGFGLPIIESQQAGRPVITSNISPMKEVADSSACLVDPYDVDVIRQGIIRVIEEVTYREELVQKGFANARRYNAGKIAGDYVNLYKWVLDGDETPFVN